MELNELLDQAVTSLHERDVDIGHIAFLCLREIRELLPNIDLTEQEQRDLRQGSLTLGALMKYDDVPVTPELVELVGQLSMEVNSPYLSTVIAKKMGDRSFTDEVIAHFKGLDPSQMDNEYDMVRLLLFSSNPEEAREHINRFTSLGYVDGIMDEIGGETFRSRFNHAFHTWCNDFDEDHPVFYREASLYAQIEALRTTTDAVIALTRGGLMGGFAARDYGLPVHVARTKRRGKGATFTWLTPEPDLTGKRVVICDNDTRKGGTALRAAREARKAGAEVLELLLHLQMSIDGDGVPGRVREAYDVVRVHTPLDAPFGDIMFKLWDMYGSTLRT